MFQIGFGMESDASNAHWWMDIIRSFLAIFDRVVYGLILYVYEIFFNIADSTIISSSLVKDFYSRVQLIIGVFMIFKVSVSLLQAVVNPDRLTDKEAGMGKIISRIVMMLAMFTAIIPLNIPYAEEGTYNAYLNENGLLFGTLYSLQSRVLGQNVLGKLILGNISTSSSEDAALKESGIDKHKSANQLATYVLKTFIRLNLTQEAVDNNRGAFDENGNLNEENLICELSSSPDGGDSKSEVEIVKAYASKNATLSDIFDYLNEECDGANGYSGDKYVFAYSPIISTICGAFFVVILLGYCIDIAVRSLKLAVLRLLAPIPIISYIDPKSSKDGSFAAWVKSLTSTYLDVFLRLAIIYLVLFIAQGMIEDFSVGGLVKGGIIGVLTKVFILIGIFYFARIAPKFIKDALGLKGNMSNFGLSGMLAAAGAIKTGGSFRDALSAAKNSADTQVAAFNQGKQAPGVMQNFQSGQDYMAQELTGNEKMTYRQMKRGERYLDREGLTTGRVEQAKNKMYEMQDEASKRKNEYDNFVRGQMTAAEEEGLARNFGHMDTATGEYVMDDDERLAAANYLQESYLNAQADAGRQEALYKDMQAEMDKRGGSRNSYRAKHGDLRDTHAAERNVRFGDLLSHDGRVDVFGSEGIRQGLRNVASMPKNAQLHRSDRRNEKIDDAIRQDKAGAEVTNNNIRNRRGP